MKKRSMTFIFFLLGGCSDLLTATDKKNTVGDVSEARLITNVDSSDQATEWVEKVLQEVKPNLENQSFDARILNQSIPSTLPLVFGGFAKPASETLVAAADPLVTKAIGLEKKTDPTANDASTKKNAVTKPTKSDADVEDKMASGGSKSPNPPNLVIASNSGSSKSAVIPNIPKPQQKNESEQNGNAAKDLNTADKTELKFAGLLTVGNKKIGLVQVGERLYRVKQGDSIGAKKMKIVSISDSKLVVNSSGKAVSYEK